MNNFLIKYVSFFSFFFLLSSAYAASGGSTFTVINADGSVDKVHIFNSSGSFIVPAGEALSGGRILVIAGGGGGGGAIASGTGGGGGGGGGFDQRSGLSFSSGTYQINVGAGGAKGTPAVQGSNGGNSTLLGPGISITTLGGGGGGAGSTGGYPNIATANRAGDVVVVCLQISVAAIHIMQAAAAANETQAFQVKASMVVVKEEAAHMVMQFPVKQILVVVVVVVTTTVHLK
ncbi:hypothetical protein AT251_15445 [Enterovibrio nigricans]|nr:hypothetical protein [Enterovibrio nigricans]PKF49896.1 hypothetical protein AT251_15445 [Enterovibrio nigricans]